MDQGIEQKLTYEERKKIKEDEKEKNRQATTRGKTAARFLKLFIFIAILALIGYGVYSFLEKNIPRGEDLSMSIPVMESARHIKVGESHEPYNSNPPTSGPHYDQTARSGFRTDILPD